MDENIYWIALRSITGIGDITFKKLVSMFETPKSVFDAGNKELLNIEGIGTNIADQITQFDKWELLISTCDKINKQGFRIIKYTDKGFPENLQNIYNPPSFFYIDGNLVPEDKQAIAIVGSRNPDRYGILATDKIVKGLVDCGITIVSGMAKGIDTAAHNSAIKYGGRTIAVLGSGLDIIYPYENRNLYQKIIQKGAVISEYDLGTKPDPGNFPRRNRIISGLSLGVIVIQAAETSGSLITAHFALEQNREVFAVPGIINSTLSKGTNKLIQRGAKLVMDVGDILSELGNSVSSSYSRNDEFKDFGNDELSEDELKVYENLGEKPIHIDQLINSTSMDTSRVLSILLELEMKDLILQLPGKYYQLNNH